MLAHAMSSTIAVTLNSMSNGAFASRCIELCPRRPGVTTTCCARNWVIIWSLTPFWRGVSTSVMMGWYSALSPALACARDTPDFRRANRYAQYSRRFSTPRNPGQSTPAMLIGTNTSGSMPSVVPRKSGGVTPTIVIARPLTRRGRPRTPGSLPKCDCQ